jgi:hypothetical protein
MPNYSESLISNSRAAKNASSTGTSAETTLVILVVRAIAAACGNGAYTASVSVSGASSAILQYVLENLHTAGYQTAIATTTLTITWAA